MTEGSKKFLPQTGLLRLIPLVCSFNILFSPRAKNDNPCHNSIDQERMRRKTSSGGEPGSGSASNSASLRSSSSRCQSVNGRASGEAEMLSQIASTRRTRSAIGNSRISATRSCFMGLSLTCKYGNSTACVEPYLAPDSEDVHAANPVLRLRNPLNSEY